MFVCDKEDECNDSDGTLFLRINTDTEITFEATTCRNRRRDPGNCRRCNPTWFPAMPISLEDNSVPIEVGCTVQCITGELSCHGNGRCPLPNEDYALYPNSICICNGNYDPRTRYKTCLRGYRLPGWLHTVLRRPVQLQPAHEPGTCDYSNATVTAAERGQSTARARQLQQGLPLVPRYDGYTAESGCRSSAADARATALCGFNQSKATTGFRA